MNQTAVQIDTEEEATELELRALMKRMGSDLKKAAAGMSVGEVRYLVDAYYMMQRARIRSAHQSRTLDEGGEPHSVQDWLSRTNSELEAFVKIALDVWSDHDYMGAWSKSICGIGPVIASGLSAHIDITRAPTVGHIWNFAGLNPDVKWEKGKWRPWNAGLKTLCFHIGECFIKTCNNKNSSFGPIYIARKMAEVKNNDEKKFADQARLRVEKVGKDTDARKWYEKGMLPPAHVHARARRYVVKLFLAAWHEVAFVHKFGTLPPKPYALQFLGHAHNIPPANMPEEVKKLRMAAGWEVK